MKREGGKPRSRDTSKNGPVHTSRSATQHRRAPRQQDGTQPDWHLRGPSPPPPLPPDPPVRRRQAAKNGLLGFLPARLRPSAVAPQRRHAWAGAARSGAALPRGGAGRAARHGSAVPACPLPPGSRVRCWQAAAGLFNTQAVISRTAAHGRRGEAPHPRSLCSTRGDWQPRGAAASATPAAASPAAAWPGLGSAAAVPICGQNRGSGSVTPTWKGADCFASAFFPRFSL